VLGRGSFGKVMLVEHKKTQKLFAMKILRKEAIEKKNQIIHTKAERKIMECINHPFIVKLHFAF
jgi:serine/threonine protein kinase